MDICRYLLFRVCLISIEPIENKQNLIIEGCYIPFDWSKDFEEIQRYANIIENRLDNQGCTLESALEDNSYMLELAKSHNVNYVLIDDKYEIDIEL